MYIIIIGNPVDGFGYTGMFETRGEAIAYAEEEYRTVEWWVAPLELPVKRED